MTSDPLAPAAVLEGMASALPTHEPGDGTSDLSSSLDCIALFVHACMINLGFRLLGFDEDQKIEAECARIAPRLPAQWNKSLSSHSFVYAHTQSSMQFVVHADRMGAKIEVRGLATGDERIARFDITARDYISSAALPLRITLTPEGTEDRSNLPQKLKTLFISEERIKDLASLLKISLIQRLLPSLHKEGYTEEPPTEPPRRRHTPPPHPRSPDHPPFPSHLPPPAAPNPYPAPDPLAAPPRRPIPAADFPPPDFEDEYEINRPPRGPLPVPGGGGGFAGLGHDDLYPAGLGPHDPIRGSFTGPGGMMGGIGPGGLRRPGAGV
ncbi:d2c28030-a8b5-4055-99a4-69b6d4a29c2e [Thermothielavioides terrestris]|uniref:D2c28030-a8b5-4055-99a4-69b6d4a29c2e n=1 Tax=Thermothielavioides terrestris TaxID=2587410 RepID=A0A3S4CA64_9PEZI|nr:d2c28030-a8b5-4055-99a4-69b6d4a29c2e [Thermothielavioides terrestris]